jgi:hypothetical protein
VRYGIEISTNPCPNLAGFIFTLIKIKILDPFLYHPEEPRINFNFYHSV